MDYAATTAIVADAADNSTACASDAALMKLVLEATVTATFDRSSVGIIAATVDVIRLRQIGIDVKSEFRDQSEN